MSDLAAFQDRLGCKFRDENLLRLALTHPSIAHESGLATAHNQRLEFLGDAVLQLILTQKLYEQFPGSDEGLFTKARSKLVNRRALAEHARAINLGAHLILAPGEESSGGREKPSVLADAFEAVLGAIYLDGGFAAAREFVAREFSTALAVVDDAPAITNPKGELQERLQSGSGQAPVYELVSATGPDHARSFECRVLHAGAELARGTGPSKKDAETAAALAALERLRGGK